ncbi:MAG: hypothetical protein GWN39_02245, partial [Thermoplasmata archaeon]|nr:hypothetical protein [Thermoplasmata archaeon]NIS10839.1 hypothetical protein [Thermoplasmata archaeon]NIS18771.1 hypothetical protein [Thermoplasmata archaeon]NIT75797.1 hypothetical protein [Thermoplasmata archaeon]NIV77584.1 hypothetical protein [Thermoplasmata archaeon]
EGDELRVTVDLSEDHGPSSSGKSTIIGTTGGSQPLEDGVTKIGLNVYRKGAGEASYEDSEGEFGKGVTYQVEGDELVLTFDLSKDFGPSSSGKTLIVASSQGNQTLPG